MMRKIIKITFLMLVLLAIYANAYAQITPLNPDEIIKSNKETQKKVINSTVQNEIFKRTEKKETPLKTETKTTPKTPVEQPKIDLTFTFSTPMILQKKISGSDKQSIEIRQLAYIIWQGYVEHCKDNGFDYNNLAQVFSYYIFANYRVLNDSENITHDQNKKIFQQMSEVFSHNQDIAKLTNEQRQEFAENLVFTAGLSVILAMAGEEEDNKELQKQAKDLAKQNLENFLGIAPEKIKITNEGLTEK